MIELKRLLFYSRYSFTRDVTETKGYHQVEERVWCIIFNGRRVLDLNTLPVDSFLRYERCQGFGSEIPYRRCGTVAS